MDNRTIVAVFLCLTIWYGWLAFFAPPPPEFEEGVDVALVGDATPVLVGDAPVAPGASDRPAPTVELREAPIELCHLSSQVYTGDGGLRAVQLQNWTGRFDVTPLYTWALTGFTGTWLPYGEDPGLEEVISAGGQLLTVGAGALDQPAPGVEIVRNGDDEVVTRGVTSDGVEITRTLSAATGEPCVIDVSVTWRNTGAGTWTGPLWLGMHDVLGDEGSRYEVAMRPRAMVDDSVASPPALEDLLAPQAEPGHVAWFGMMDSYFGAFMVPVPGSEGTWYFSPSPDGQQLAHGGQYAVTKALPAGAAHAESFRFYVGPKYQEELAAVDPSLGKAVELGFLSFFASPLLWLLKFLHGIVGNWGWAIILLTVTVKMFFFPLTQRSFKSQQAMQAIQPEMTRIREEYKDNPEEMNRRVMALFRDTGVNPLGGCLPMIIQMPVWFALYSVLLSSVELYHAEFLFLKDLSAVDPYIGMPIVVVGLMVLQQQFMPTGNMDPAQAKMMKLMPLMFGFFFFTFPSGLVLYIFVNMTLSIAQQWYIKRTFGGMNTVAAA